MCFVCIGLQLGLQHGKKKLCVHIYIYVLCIASLFSLCVQNTQKSTMLVKQKRFVTAVNLEKKKKNLTRVLTMLSLLPPK